jgi:hypothetical protein
VKLPAIYEGVHFQAGQARPHGIGNLKVGHAQVEQALSREPPGQAHASEGQPQGKAEPKDNAAGQERQALRRVPGYVVDANEHPKPEQDIASDIGVPDAFVLFESNGRQELRQEENKQGRERL